MARREGKLIHLVLIGLAIAGAFYLYHMMAHHQGTSLIPFK